MVEHRLDKSNWKHGGKQRTVCVLSVESIRIRASRDRPQRVSHTNLRAVQRWRGARSRRARLDVRARAQRDQLHDRHSKMRLGLGRHHTAGLCGRDQMALLANRSQNVSSISLRLRFRLFWLK